MEITRGLCKMIHLNFHGVRQQHLNPGGAIRLREQFFNRGNSNKSCLQEKNRIKMFKRNKKGSVRM